MADSSSNATSSTSLFNVQGFSLYSTQEGQFSSAAAYQQLQTIVATGGTSVSLIYSYHQDSQTSNTVYANSETELPSDITTIVNVDAPP